MQEVLQGFYHKYVAIKCDLLCSCLIFLRKHKWVLIIFLKLDIISIFNHGSATATQARLLQALQCDHHLESTQHRMSKHVALKHTPRVSTP
jgi:hypothetical protein